MSNKNVVQNKKTIEKKKSKDLNPEKVVVDIENSINKKIEELKKEKNFDKFQIDFNRDLEKKVDYLRDYNVDNYGASLLIEKSEQLMERNDKNELRFKSFSTLREDFFKKNKRGQPVIPVKKNEIDSKKTFFADKVTKIDEIEVVENVDQRKSDPIFETQQKEIINNDQKNISENVIWSSLGLVLCILLFFVVKHCYKK